MPPAALNPQAHPELAQWFETQVQPHEPALRSWLRLRFPAVGDRDDLVQESYLRLWQVRLSRPIESPKAYLFAIARNLALNHLRHSKFEGDVGEIDLSRVLDEEVPVPEQVARLQEIHALHAAFQSLPDRCREVFTLRRIYGLSQKEIAQKLGISEKTVEVQCFKAMRLCREYFRTQEQLTATATAPSPAPTIPFAPAKPALR